MYYSIGLKDKALSLFDVGLSYDSLHLDMLNYVGIIFTEKNNYELGIQYFNKVLSIEPEHKHALNNLDFINRKR